MANSTVNAPALPRGAVMIHATICAVESVIAGVRAWNARRRTSRELSKLSRTQLADIGLDGVDLDDLAARLRR